MKKLTFFVALIFLFSCSQADDKYLAREMNNNVFTSSTATSNSKAYQSLDFSQKDNKQNGAVTMQTPNFNRKMIKKADYKFEVEDVDATTVKVHHLAEQFSAFVANMNLSTSPTSMTNQMTIRVMNEQFEPLLNALSKEAVFVHHKKIHSQDVTEQFVDLESRLKIKKEVKDRYTQMLRKDAKTLEQVLHAEEKIRVLQEEIESKEGRLRFLSDQVSLSEIKLEVYQEVEYQEKLQVQNKSFAQKATGNFLNGWNNILNVALGILNYWHLGLLLGFAWLGRSSILGLIRRY